MPSFDTMLEANATEVRNAIDQVNKEVANRFDFKGSDARVEQKDKELTAYANDDFQLGQVKDIILAKCAKRNVDVRFLDFADSQKIGGDKLKQTITVRNGLAGDDVKKVVKAIKDSKMKLQASIQGDVVRVTGAKRDDLQAAMALLKKEIEDLPISFGNFRD